MEFGLVSYGDSFMGAAVRVTTWALVGCLILCPALAADKTGVYAVRGSGMASCGKWVQNRRERGAPYYEEAGWLAGYVTAVNAYEWPERDIAQGLHADGIEGWIDTYCSAHPTDSLAVAAHALIAELLVNTV